VARNVELYPALPISSTSIQRNHEFGNADTAKSNLSRNELFGITQYWIASGGVALAGAATTSKSTVFTASVSGGVVVAGAAATEYVSGSTTYTYSPSGGVTLAGAAALARTYAVTVSGGTSLAGTAVIARTLIATVSGGVTLGGAAATSEIAVYTATVSGGATLGGSAVLARTYSPAASGGTVLAGAADTSYLSAGATEYPYAATGGVTVGGAAATQYVEATPQQEQEQAGSGGSWWIRRVEQAPIWRTTYWSIFRYEGSGGPTLGGTSPVSVVKAPAATGARLSLVADARVSKSVSRRGSVAILLKKAQGAQARYERARWLVEEEEFLKLIA